MAKIPTADQLGYVTPRTARGIVTDRSGEILAAGIQESAKNISQLARTADEFADRRDRLNYALAKSDLLNAEADVQKSLRENPNLVDVESFDKEYRDRMSKAKDAASKRLRDKRQTQAFDLDFEDVVRRGAASVYQFGFSKERDIGRASVNQSAEALRNNAMTEQDDLKRSQIIEAARGLFQGLVESGYSTKEEAESDFLRWRDSMVTGRIESQTPEKQIEMLNDEKGIAGHLRPDVRAKMLERAKKESRSLTVKRESQEASDLILGKHRGDWKAARDAAREIKDPEVRDMTQSRIEHEWQVAQKLESDDRDAAMEEGQAFIDNGGKFADLPIKLKSRMKPSMLNSLRSYADQTAGGGKVKTDPAETLRLSNLYAMDPQAFGDEDPKTWIDKLGESDYERWVQRWSNVRSGKDDSGKDSGYRTIAQKKADRMVQLFGSANPKKGEGEKKTKKREMFNDAWEAEIETFKAQHGRVPSGKDADDILERLTSTVVMSSEWFNSEKRAYELTEEDIPIPDADRNQIIQALRKRGKPVTDEAIMELYKRVNP